MVVENRKTAVNGSSALATSARPLPNERVQNPKIDKGDREAKRQARKVKFKKHISFNLTVLAAGIIGGVIVARYSSIYANQKEIIALQESIYEMKEESEALSVKLLQYDNIAYIEEVAINKLNMVKPDSGEVVYCDLDIVTPIDEKGKDSEEGGNFFSKIKELLFN